MNKFAIYCFLGGILISFAAYGGGLDHVKTGAYDILMVEITKVHDEKPKAVWDDMVDGVVTIERGLYKIEYVIEEFMYANNTLPQGERKRLLLPNLFRYVGSSLWITENSNPMLCTGVKSGDKIILVLSKPNPLSEGIIMAKFEISDREIINNEIKKIIKNNLDYYAGWMDNKINEEK